MDTLTALNELLGPNFVMRMARHLAGPRWDLLLPADSGKVRGAKVRMQNALLDAERVMATWAATRHGHGYSADREVHPGYPGDPKTCLYGSLRWTWINDGQNLVCPVCGLDGT